MTCNLGLHMRLWKWIPADMGLSQSEGKFLVMGPCVVWNGEYREIVVVDEYEELY